MWRDTWRDTTTIPTRAARRRLSLAAGALATSAVLLAACAATGSSSPKAQVKRDWVAFFSPGTSATKKVALLEDGSRFAPLLQQLGSMAQSVSATVQSVTIDSSSTATVTYSLLLGGTPVLQHQQGEAVKQAGVWKVSVASLCGLLALEGKRESACSTSGTTGASGSTGASGASGATGTSGVTGPSA